VAECAWSPCDQTPQLGSPLCYYHAKILSGLVDSAEQPSAKVMAIIEELQERENE
jgi:hypothetical protein